MMLSSIVEMIIWGNELFMKSQKTGLGLIREVGWADQTRVHRRKSDRAEASSVGEKHDPIERPKIGVSTVVFCILFALIYSYCVSVLLRDQAKGRVILVPDYGAPPPCMPPSEGLWPDCHQHEAPKRH
jgi:hypothetical protein